MREFIKQFFSVHWRTILNFVVATGILKFYFDKKLATQKEESNKEIAELNGVIARGNYAHAIIIQKKIELYEKIWKSISDFLIICIEINSFCEINGFKEKLPELLKQQTKDSNISDKQTDEINEKFKRLDEQSFATIKLISKKLVYINEKEELYKSCKFFLSKFILPIRSDFSIYFDISEDMHANAEKIENNLKEALNETMEM